MFIDRNQQILENDPDFSRSYSYLREEDPEVTKCSYLKPWGTSRNVRLLAKTAALSAAFVSSSLAAALTAVCLQGYHLIDATSRDRVVKNSLISAKIGGSVAGGLVGTAIMVQTIAKCTRCAGQLFGVSLRCADRFYHYTNGWTSYMLLSAFAGFFYPYSLIIYCLKQDSASESTNLNGFEDLSQSSESSEEM